MTQASPRRFLAATLVPLALLLAAAGLRAETPPAVELTGAAEVPPVSTAATGTARISVLPDRTLSGSLSTSGLQPTMAHIHEAAAGKNGPPIVTLLVTRGNGFAVPAGAVLSEAQYASYLAGNLYINVHSAAYPDGEIRAQLPGKPMRIAN